MSQQDSRGLLLSTDSEVAAAAYREGIDLLFSAWPGADVTLDNAIAADPDFALAHAARARLHTIDAEPGKARERAATAQETVARRGTEREKSHVEILALMSSGKSGMALEKTLAHCDAWPRDAMILSLPLGAFGLFAFSGMKDHDQARVDLCERHAAHYDDRDWWFLVNQGWSYAENGQTAPGRDLTQRGFELRKENAHAVHALAHAMFEQGKNDEIEGLVSGWLPTYAREGILHGHIAWHAALVALEQDDAAKALSLYEDYIKPSASFGVPINVVSDTSAFLWRYGSYGHAVPAGLWEEAVAYGEKAFSRVGFAFVDWHMALLEAGSGNKEALGKRIAALDDMQEKGLLAVGPVMPAICRAALAFAEGDYAQCVRVLEPLLPEVVRVGGSGAQRQIIEDTLLIALIRNNEAEKASELLERRLHRYPSPRDLRWRVELGM